MIKKVFVGVLLAGVFGLLILGAVNRTLAKSDKLEPLALSEGSSRGNGTEDGYQNYEQLTLSGNRSEQGRNNNGTAQGTNQNIINETAHGGNKSTGSNDFGQGGSGSGDALVVGQADVESWADPITVTVDKVSSDLWIVSNDEGFLHEIEGRSLSFMMDNGFEVVPGDELVLSGFYEGDKFEIGVITNNTTQQTLTLREATGRPLWAGGGRRNTLP
jgi:hypothetical protein